MPDHQDLHPKKRRESRKSSRIILLIFLILIAATGSYLFYAHDGQKEKDGWQRPKADQEDSHVAEPMLPPPTPEQQPLEPTGENHSSPEGNTAQKTPLCPLPAPLNEQEKKGDQKNSSLLPPQRSCPDTAVSLNRYFKELEREEALQPFNLHDAAQIRLLELAARLLDNPPVVVRETDQLITILKNMAHFFRILGKENIQLAQTILNHQPDSIEDTAADLYNWSISGCSTTTLPLTAPLKKMYEYAGFFLNTIGGRAYLFRRDTRTRLLVTYYSILLVEQANKNGSNRYGIDLSRFVQQLIREIESSNELKYQESYLDQLYSLQEKYPPPE